jgi:hypothetical protein
VAGPRAGSPGHVPDLLAGLAGATVGAAATLIQGAAVVSPPHSGTRGHQNAAC